MTNSDGLKRAWFFIKVKKNFDTITVAKLIYKKFGGKEGGSKNYLLVRADVVDSNFTFAEIIAPVVAKDNKSIRAAKSNVESLSEVASVTEAMVSEHVPSPPKAAEEDIGGDRGSNKWG